MPHIYDIYKDECDHACRIKVLMFILEAANTDCIKV